MRQILIGSLALALALAFATASTLAMTRSEMELVKFSGELVNVAETIKNLDNSVTFKGISIIRGDQRYLIDGISTNYDSVCKMLGFEKSLTGANLNEKYSSDYVYWTVAVLNSEGRYKLTISSKTYISKVTCHNTNELRPVVDYTKTRNPDGSVKVTNIQYHRGDKVFGIDPTSTTFDSACKVVGYDRSLAGGNLNTTYFSYYDVSWTLVQLDLGGDYIETTHSNSRIDKVTCHSPTVPNSIIKIGNKRYRRIITNI